MLQVPKEGDLTEYKAIQKLFMKAYLINHKQVENRHTFGASGMLSLELAYTNDAAYLHRYPFVKAQNIQSR
jgi:hypothetical protein